jgi:hypothetical protein
MTEHDHARWLTDRQRAAQISAHHWAEVAEAEHRNATEHEDRARSLAGQPFTTDDQDSARRLASFHGGRSSEAVRLAEMWARVATVLVPPPAPMELVSFGPEPEPSDG